MSTAINLYTAYPTWDNGRLVLAVDGQISPFFGPYTSYESARRQARAIVQEHAQFYTDEDVIVLRMQSERDMDVLYSVLYRNADWRALPAPAGCVYVAAKVRA